MQKNSLYPILAAWLVKHAGLMGADIVQVHPWTEDDCDLYISALFPIVR